ncbi:MAG: GTPase HflX [Betaproteobacteria bacterium]|nr:GTPase HflX [Betaproteobacteria bacterium]
MSVEVSPAGTAQDIEGPQRAILAAVQLPGVSDADFQSSLDELKDLAGTLGYLVVGTFAQKRERFDMSAYVGVGKRQEMRRFIEGAPARELHASNSAPRRALRSGLARAKEAAESAVDESVRQADLVLVDHEISPSQARNLEIEVGCPVMDRSMVILEIFHRHASSRAARAQVEIARLGYMAPRLREATRLAGSKGRQRSGTGGRGAGEAHSELDRKKIRDRIAELKKDIDAMDVEQKTQRSRRQERLGIARVALVGYTNAGKSTLMRVLTGSEVLVANKLFATLDTTVRALQPEGVPRILVSDTVGFIKNLPHDLVASFKSTLEEALEASLLLHVIDASDPGHERQLAVTDAVLAEIGAGGVPRIRVFNKIDRVGSEAGGADDAAAQAAQDQCAAELAARYAGCVVMSARRPADIERLKALIRGFFRRQLAEAELFLGWGAQQLRGRLFASCEVLEERADEDGAHFRVRGVPEVIQGLKKQFAPPPRASIPAEEKAVARKPVAGKAIARKSAAAKSGTTAARRRRAKWPSG